MRALERLAPGAADLTWEISEVADQYHVSCLDQASGQGGGGFAANLATAKKIAFAELNERRFLFELNKRPELHAAWGLDTDLSGSGFAVGYSRSKALLRATCEAAERWALARWIDRREAIATVEEINASAASRRIEEFFRDVSTFKTHVPVLINDTLVAVHVAVVLGWSDRGVFAGYGARLVLDEAIEHAYVEALRNYLIFENQSVRGYFPYDRIDYFGRNRHSAEAILAQMKPGTSQTPTLRLARVQQFGDLWLARVMLDDWVPWQLGPVDRFLY